MNQNFLIGQLLHHIFERFKVALLRIFPLDRDVMIAHTKRANRACLVEQRIARIDCGQVYDRLDSICRHRAKLVLGWLTAVMIRSSTFR